ncbi:C-X-C motif chemokine 13 [Octodon degus]|uniref:C-X-C motif chemokine 13 n=1 Tax=Octodon degus TaxID=10160 RepID=A0A6P3FRP7_OCTDE|nr:C-X-C motif chemokine 13 [Octodon degus]
MRLSAAALLLALLVCSLSPGQGILEAYNTNLKCRCKKVTSRIFRPPHIRQLQVRTPGNGCPNTEIIIQLKTTSIVCLNPQAKWVQQLLTFIERRKLRSTAPAPVTKKGS